MFVRTLHEIERAERIDDLIALGERINLKALDFWTRRWVEAVMHSAECMAWALAQDELPLVNSWEALAEWIWLGARAQPFMAGVTEDSHFLMVGQALGHVELEPLSGLCTAMN